MIDYKEYAKQMRKNSIAINGILQVAEELWLQIADIIDDLAEKQIPKKTTKRQYVPNGTLVYGHCPNCDSFPNNFFNYCRNCGQALDWGQEE